MSNPTPLLCNTCRMPSTACACSRNLMYQFWPQPLQHQTPRRPMQQLATQTSLTQSTPHRYVPTVSGYPAFAPAMYDPRLQPLSNPAHASAHPMNPQTRYLPPPLLQSTPSRPNVPTSSMPQQPLSPVFESPAPANRDGRKRKRTVDGAKTNSKRARQSRTQLSASREENEDPSLSVPGVGPSSSILSDAPATRPKPIADYSPISKPCKSKESKQVATDVWYFVRPLEARKRPVGPTYDPPPSREKPKTPFVGCRLCPLSTAWSVWANINGMADTIRNHLSSKHGDEWRKIVVIEKLKNWDKISGCDADDVQREPFTLEGFLERLMRWIAVDDQSLNVVECRELRDLLLYLNANIDESDIPHRTKVTQLIFKSYHREWQRLVTDLRNSKGRISFTSDLWSDPNLRSFMAVTAHFAAEDENGNLVTRSRLVAFRFISGTHSGAHLAEHFLEILKELGIVNKIGMITLDNASNCGSMMDDLERLLREMGVPFSREGNRIRCFPHVVNIAVKAALKELSASAPDITQEDDVPFSWDHNENDPEYQAALDNDVVARCRSLVTACRASGQRREDLQATITEGNKSKSFPNGNSLRNVELLRDMDVRWSSTYLMIDRVLELYPAIDVLLNKVKYKDIHRHLLDDVELRVLHDIAEFLKIPHAVQTTLCGEKTPTLSAVLPAYEDLLEMLKSYKVICPQLRSAISVCIEKIEEYVKKSRKTRIYALAMIINPITKLKWIEDHWTKDEYTAAKNWMLESMFEYKKINRSRLNVPLQSRPRSTGPSAASAKSQAAGLAYIRTLKANLLRSASQILAGPQASNSATDLSTQTSSDAQDTEAATRSIRTEADLQAESAIADEKDRIAVADELQRYVEEGLLDETEYGDFSITRYWQARKYQFPSMYCVALDILPVQASSVACERVFSSSKETITMRRNCLSPELMEVLQFLKYTYRQDRLNLMEGLVASEHELLEAEEVSMLPEEVRDLLMKGQIDQLIALLKS